MDSTWATQRHPGSKFKSIQGITRYILLKLKQLVTLLHHMTTLFSVSNSCWDSVCHHSQLFYLLSLWQVCQHYERETVKTHNQHNLLVLLVLLETFKKCDGKHMDRGTFFLIAFLFAICTSTFSKLCKRRIQWHVEECSVALLCN
jgi:hypothetical protein